MAQTDAAAGAERLRVSDLTKTFGRLIALDGVSCSIRAGEVLGLIGPNGAGKTTLFECLAGLLPADRGEVTVDGRSIPTSERGDHLFYVPDGIAPWPSQTVRWALTYAAGFFSGSPEAIPQITARLDLSPLLDSRIGTLSKGQRKRVALAIGLLTPTPVLLVDEPFDGLDLRQSRDLAKTLRDGTDGGRTLFLSIHQITDAARVCDRFVLLSGGRVCGEGTLDELSRLAPNHSRDLEDVFLALT